MKKPGSGYTMALVDGKRVRVIEIDGVKGYAVRWTEACSNCSGDDEYQAEPERGGGCEECGHTGKRRRNEWVPLDGAEADKMAAQNDAQEGSAP